LAFSRCWAFSPESIIRSNKNAYARKKWCQAVIFGARHKPFGPGPFPAGSFFSPFPPGTYHRALALPQKSQGGKRKTKRNRYTPELELLELPRENEKSSEHLESSNPLV
jgi:hypothetical protein